MPTITTQSLASTFPFPAMRVMPRAAGRSASVSRPRAGHDVDALLAGIVKRNQRLAEAQGVQIEATASGSIAADVPSTAVEVRAQAVLRAALARATWGSTLTLELRCQGHHAEFDVGLAVATPECSACLGNVDWIDERWSWRLA